MKTRVILVLFISPAFPQIPSHSYMLSNDTSRPNNNYISHGKQAQIVKTRLFYIAYYTSYVYFKISILTQ
jgi:hypothetical protein